MANEIVLLEVKKRKLFIGNLVGFIVWQLPYLFHYFTSSPILILSGISVLGWLIWVYYDIRLLQFSRLLRKKRELARSLNDEYFQMIRLKSLAAAFVLLLGSIVALFVLGFIVDLNVQFALHALIVVGVAGALIFYLIFNKDN